MSKKQENEWTLTKGFRDMHGSGFVEASCFHGIGHHRGVHGCDGCCSTCPKEVWEQTTNEGWEREEPAKVSSGWLREEEIMLAGRPAIVRTNLEKYRQLAKEWWEGKNH